MPWFRVASCNSSLVSPPDSSGTDDTAFRWHELRPERSQGLEATVRAMQVDLLFDPFGARWADVRGGALAAEAAGFDGVWLYDHLAGSVHGASHVLECWTTLSAIAALVPRIVIGPLVLNVANRDPGVLAVMAATLQQVSEGRLLLGLGAGGGIDTPYAAEQEALGRRVLADPARRGAVEDAIAVLRATWSGAVAGVGGFLRPEPPPPIIIGAFGPKMAELAGRLADGINVPAGPGMSRLVELAGEARARAGRSPDGFVVTTSGQPSAREREALTKAGVDRLIVFVRPPYLDGIERARRTVEP
jgi:alkanesulfonate monooxygenase SsuD/methylene tetrahydromethanopterin reductase-like flavin-dependent oxidoreductase (luciferase family)